VWVPPIHHMHIHMLTTLNLRVEKTAVRAKHLLGVHMWADWPGLQDGYTVRVRRQGNPPHEEGEKNHHRSPAIVGGPGFVKNISLKDRRDDEKSIMTCRQ
jgi:hypothetical protein